MQIPKEYSIKYTVTADDVQDGELKISTRLRLQQKVGEDQLSLGGYTPEKLVEMGYGFILVMSRGRRYSGVSVGEELTFTTWYRETVGMRIYRCYSIFGDDGRVVSHSGSVFTTINPENHRLVRPKALLDKINCGDRERRSECPDSEKFDLPSLSESIGEVSVEGRHIDLYGHMNNSFYGDMMTDFLPCEMRLDSVFEFGITFEKEALLGDKISLFRGSLDGVTYYKGIHSRGECFRGYLRQSE